MYKLRFNLQHGKHYKHWQITDICQGTKHHFDPDESFIIRKFI